MKKLQLRLIALTGLSLLSAALMAGCGSIPEKRPFFVSTTEEFYQKIDVMYGSSLSQSVERYKPNQAVGLD